ncbi:MULTISPECIES: hypothetical protein [unclassified Imperialibacter]|uniref:hypothetical protein n=1 Tax=unclassified Imperialibacter TaxID=2629706 RepID=UPI00125F5CE9|nr:MULTISPECIES: hypothetical protein [unclassified Imperialibacter]
MRVRPLIIAFGSGRVLLLPYSYFIGKEVIAICSDMQGVGATSVESVGELSHLFRALYQNKVIARPVY